MKHNVRTSELLVLGVLVLAVAYILLVHLPIKEQLETLDARQNELQTEISTLQSKLQSQMKMKAEVDRVLAASKKTTPVEIPKYDNISPMTMELNTIFADSKRYSINFGTEQYDDKIVRRTVTITFSESSYEKMRAKLTSICNSKNMYLITAINTTMKQDLTDYNTSITLISFEYNAGTTTK